MSATILADFNPALAVLWPRPNNCGGASRRGRTVVRDIPFTEPEPVLLPLLNPNVGGRIGGGFFTGIDVAVDADADEAPFATTTFTDDCNFSGRLILLILQQLVQRVQRVHKTGGAAVASLY